MDAPGSVLGTGSGGEGDSVLQTARVFSCGWMRVSFSEIYALFTFSVRRKCLKVPFPLQAGQRFSG